MSLPTRNYAGIDSAITQRPVSGAILGIDSEDRFTDMTQARDIIGNLSLPIISPYSFTITKATSILNGFFTRIGVTEVMFPWTIPNVNRRTRQILVKYQVGAGPIAQVELVLPTGFYTPSQLASAIQIGVRAIDASLNAFTITYGTGAPLEVPPPYASAVTSSIPAFTYATNVAGTTIAFLPMPAPSTAYTPGGLDYNFPAYTRQLFDVLGFTSGNYILQELFYGGYTLCQAVKYVDIVCTQITNNQALKDNSSQVVNRDMLCRLYVADPSSPSNVDCKSSTFCPAGCMPFTIYRNFATPKYIQWLPNQPVPGVLKFEVYSDDGSLLTDIDTNLLNGYGRTDWAITLLVSEN
jgi:hypothetical protein